MSRDATDDDGRQTREDKATQPLDDGRLSFAITTTEQKVALKKYPKNVQYI